MKALFITGSVLCLAFSGLCLGFGIDLFVNLPLHLPNGLIDTELLTFGIALIGAAVVAAFFSYLCFDLAR